MIKSESSSSSGSIGVLGLLGVVFVTLKLAGIGVVAEWSWWWGTLPFWGGAVMGIVLIAAVFLMAARAASK